MASMSSREQCNVYGLPGLRLSANLEVGEPSSGIYSVCIPTEKLNDNMLRSFKDGPIPQTFRTYFLLFFDLHCRIVDALGDEHSQLYIEMIAGGLEQVTTKRFVDVDRSELEQWLLSRSTLHAQSEDADQSPLQMETLVQMWTQSKKAMQNKQQTPVFASRHNQADSGRDIDSDNDIDTDYDEIEQHLQERECLNDDDDDHGMDDMQEKMDSGRPHFPAQEESIVKPNFCQGTAKFVRLYTVTTFEAETIIETYFDELVQRNCKNRQSVTFPSGFGSGATGPVASPTDASFTGNQEGSSSGTDRDRKRQKMTREVVHSMRQHLLTGNPYPLMALFHSSTLVSVYNVVHQKNLPQTEIITARDMFGIGAWEPNLFGHDKHASTARCIEGGVHGVPQFVVGNTRTLAIRPTNYSVVMETPLPPLEERISTPKERRAQCIATSTSSGELGSCNTLRAIESLVGAVAQPVELDPMSNHSLRERDTLVLCERVMESIDSQMQTKRMLLSYPMLNKHPVMRKDLLNLINRRIEQTRISETLREEPPLRTAAAAGVMSVLANDRQARGGVQHMPYKSNWGNLSLIGGFMVDLVTMLTPVFSMHNAHELFLQLFVAALSAFEQNHSVTCVISGPPGISKSWVLTLLESMMKGNYDVISRATMCNDAVDVNHDGKIQVQHEGYLAELGVGQHRGGDPEQLMKSRITERRIQTVVCELIKENNTRRSKHYSAFLNVTRMIACNFALHKISLEIRNRVVGLEINKNPKTDVDIHEVNNHGDTPVWEELAKDCRQKVGSVVRLVNMTLYYEGSMLNNIQMSVTATASTQISERLQKLGLLSVDKSRMLSHVRCFAKTLVALNAVLQIWTSPFSPVAGKVYSPEQWALLNPYLTEHSVEPLVLSWGLLRTQFVPSSFIDIISELRFYLFSKSYNKLHVTSRTATPATSSPERTTAAPNRRIITAQTGDAGELEFLNHFASIPAFWTWRVYLRQVYDQQGDHTETAPVASPDLLAVHEAWDASSWTLLSRVFSEFSDCTRTILVQDPGRSNTQYDRIVDPNNNEQNHRFRCVMRCLRWLGFDLFETYDLLDVRLRIFTDPLNRLSSPYSTLLTPEAATLVEVVRRCMEYELRRHYMATWIPYMDQQFKLTPFTVLNNKRIHYYSNIQRDSLPNDNQGEDEKEVDSARMESLVNHMKQVPVVQRLAEDTEICIKKAQYLRQAHTTQIKAQHAEALDSLIIGNVAGIVFGKDKSIDISQGMIKAFAFGGDPYLECVRDVMEQKIDAPTTVTVGFSCNMDHRIVDTMVLIPATSHSDKKANRNASSSNLCIDGVIEHITGRRHEDRNLANNIVDSERMDRTRKVSQIKAAILDDQGITEDMAVSESIFMEAQNTRQRQVTEREHFKAWLVRISKYIEVQENNDTGLVGHVSAVERTLQAIADLPPPNRSATYPAEYAVKHHALDRTSRDRTLELGFSVVAHVLHTPNFYHDYVKAVLRERTSKCTHVLPKEKLERGTNFVAQTFSDWQARVGRTQHSEANDMCTHDHDTEGTMLDEVRVTKYAMAEIRLRLPCNGFYDNETDYLILQYLERNNRTV